MTSARDRMAEAAAYLDDLATHAPYSHDVKNVEQWRVDVAGPIASIKWLGLSHDVLTATWMQAALVDMCSPAFVRLVANLLRVESYDSYDDADHTTCTTQTCRTVAALELADQILKVKGTAR